MENVAPNSYLFPIVVILLVLVKLLLVKERLAVGRVPV